MNFFKRIETMREMALTASAIAIIFAGIAELAGFSLAIGAFFGGLIFSRDPTASEMLDAFEAPFELLSPFFFIGIGLHIDPGVVFSALGLGALFFVFAALSKVAANWLPLRILRGPVPALLIGVSMVPRAEITMVIMKHGKAIGEGIISDRVFAAMVFVSLATCILGPMSTAFFLKRNAPEGD